MVVKQMREGGRESTSVADVRGTKLTCCSSIVEHEKQRQAQQKGHIKQAPKNAHAKNGS